MQAGRLDRRVTLRRKVSGLDAAGGETATWVTVGENVAASRTPIRDDERIRAAAVGASATDRFQVRWAEAWKDLAPEDQLDCEGRAYDVVAVKEIGRRRGLEITAVRLAERAA